jgi:hypothetical protein
MQKNSQNFSMQEALRLANSDAGQQLLALLKQTPDPGLRQALNYAATGDYERIKESLSSVLASQEVQNLLKELEARNG